jgi:8-oxo-dGTP pyrophosphatase MutT (NUDIX family)
MISAARRELFEETGLTPDQIWLCGTITIDTGVRPGIGIFVYRGECKTCEFRESKEGTLAWVPVDQVYSLPLVEDLPTLIPKVLETDRGSAPFSALYAYDKDDQLQINFGT